MSNAGVPLPALPDSVFASGSLALSKKVLRWSLVPRMRPARGTHPCVRIVANPVPARMSLRRIRGTKFPSTSCYTGRFFRWEQESGSWAPDQSLPRTSIRGPG